MVELSAAMVGIDRCMMQTKAVPAWCAGTAEASGRVHRPFDRLRAIRSAGATYPLKISTKIITRVKRAKVSTKTSPRIMDARMASAAPGFRAMPSQAEDPIFDCA